MRKAADVGEPDGGGGTVGGRRKAADVGEPDGGGGTERGRKAADVGGGVGVDGTRKAQGKAGEGEKQGEGHREGDRGRMWWCELRVETSLWDGQASRGGENKLSEHASRAGALLSCSDDALSTTARQTTHTG